MKGGRRTEWGTKNTQNRRRGREKKTEKDDDQPCIHTFIYSYTSDDPFTVTILIIMMIVIIRDDLLEASLLPSIIHRITDERRTDHLFFCLPSSPSHHLILLLHPSAILWPSFIDSTNRPILPLTLFPILLFLFYEFSIHSFILCFSQSSPTPSWAWWWWSHQFLYDPETDAMCVTPHIFITFSCNQSIGTFMAFFETTSTEASTGLENDPQTMRTHINQYLHHDHHWRSSLYWLHSLLHLEISVPYVYFDSIRWSEKREVNDPKDHLISQSPKGEKVEMTCWDAHYGIIVKVMLVWNSFVIWR